jgi:hypothetical protein
VPDTVLVGRRQNDRKKSGGFFVGKSKKCREVFECNEEECPGFQGKDFKCWLRSETFRHDNDKGKKLSKLEMCLGCKVFWANVDIPAMKDVVKSIYKQFGGLRKVVRERDKELESLSLELALASLRSLRR